MYRSSFKIKILYPLKVTLHFIACTLFIISQLAFTSTSVAASTSSSGGGYTFGTMGKDLIRASVSVVRLVATYSPPPGDPTCASSPTGIGVLVGSWAVASTTGTDYLNWLLTDGAFVNPQGLQCGTGKGGTSQLAGIQIYVNTAYTNAATGLALKSLKCQAIAGSTPAACGDGKVSEALRCQASPCASGVILIPFHTSVPQPYIPMALADQVSPVPDGIELTGASSFPPPVGQVMQALTPTRVAIGASDQKIEQGVPIVDSTGQFLDMHLNAPDDPAGTIRGYVSDTIGQVQTNPVQSNWDSGVDAFYAHDYPAARTAFQLASAPNPQFKAPAGFLGLSQFRGVSSTPTPHSTPASNGQPVNLFGLQIPYGLFLPVIIVGVVLVVLLLALVSFLFIRKRAQAQRRGELVGSPDANSRCPNCHQAVRSGAAFCGNCGFSLLPGREDRTTAMTPPLGGVRQASRQTPKPDGPPVSPVPEQASPVKGREPEQAEIDEDEKMPSRVGEQLGNYKLVRLLGEGGFAEVYLGEHIHLGSHAAIKVLHSQLTSKEREEFRAEARTLVNLVHPHIVRLLDFGIAGKTPYLVMDYAPHGTLRQLYPWGTRLPIETILSYVRQIAEALQFAHDEKLIHRDVKPENMLLGRHNEVLLSDFGLAIVSQSQSSRYIGDSRKAGTAAYMAPEQFNGRPRPASDQYALGVVVYEWLCGEPPFSEGNFIQLGYQHTYTVPPPLHQSLPTIPPLVEQVVLRALAKDPAERWPSVQSFAEALERAR